jgi:BirA family biotin operon repressor/biotin-[acetyl-CoA-carboxylase] ligase
MNEKSPKETNLCKPQTSFKNYHFPVIGSTQDYLIENAASLFHQTNQVVVTTDEQTKGRGTSNRMWASPPNLNIYATFAVKIPHDFAIYFDMVKSPAIMEIIALAVAKTLEDFGFKPTIKWRNDVLLNNKKICGILCEAKLNAEGVVGLVGIGLNVNMPKEICDALDQPVTSMAVEAGYLLSKEQVFNCLAGNVDYYINLYLQKNFAQCLPEINARLAFVGKLIHVEGQLSKQTIEGVCLGIDEGGQLKVKTHDGVIHLVRWGRILKDELTYPEAFVSKPEQKAEKTQTENLSAAAPYLATLGIGAFGYAAYVRFKAATAASPSSTSKAGPVSTSSSKLPSEYFKQGPPKRQFSTASAEGAWPASRSVPPKPQPKFCFTDKKPFLTEFFHLKFHPIISPYVANPSINQLSKTLQSALRRLKR